MVARVNKSPPIVPVCGMRQPTAAARLPSLPVFAVMSKCTFPWSVTLPSAYSCHGPSARAGFSTQDHAPRRPVSDFAVLKGLCRAHAKKRRCPEQRVIQCLGMLDGGDQGALQVVDALEMFAAQVDAAVGSAIADLRAGERLTQIDAGELNLAARPKPPCQRALALAVTRP